MKHILIVAAALTGFAALTFANDLNENSQRKSNLSSADARFVREASSGGQAEVEFGRLLTQKAQSQELKDYGQHLVDDHTKANEKLAQIASSKGIDVPTEPTAASRAQLQKLEASNNFDEAAQRHAIKDHQEDIKKFSEAVRSLHDPDLKQYAQETLPVLQEHLRHAKELHLGARTTAQR